MTDLEYSPRSFVGRIQNLLMVSDTVLFNEELLKNKTRLRDKPEPLRIAISCLRNGPTTSLSKDPLLLLKPHISYTEIR